MGYSFSKTDFCSDWLFRQVNILTKRNNKIVIIDPDTEKKQSGLLKKYNGLFTGLEISTFLYLKDYLKHNKI